MQSIPTIEEITAAAKASALTTPRPSRAFWIEAIRSYIEQPQWLIVHTGATSSAAVMRRTETMTERDLRAFFIELLIIGTKDDDAARIRWGAVFGLCEAP